MTAPIWRPRRRTSKRKRGIYFICVQYELRFWWMTLPIDYAHLIEREPFDWLMCLTFRYLPLHCLFPCWKKGSSVWHMWLPMHPHLLMFSHVLCSNVGRARVLPVQRPILCREKPAKLTRMQCQLLVLTCTKPGPSISLFETTYGQPDTVGHLTNSPISSELPLGTSTGALCRGNCTWSVGR